MLNLDKRKRLITEINMVPFTDVVLVLLIIFMVTTPFLFQGAFKVELPKVTAPNPSLPESAILSVAPGGRLALDGRELRLRNSFGPRLVTSRSRA
jgi:biopolymer transport protein ExbD